MESPSLQEALSLIAEGYSPFPINGPEKVPLVKFSKVIIGTEEEAREHRWRGIGIHLGRSKCWVLDIDGEEGYAELKKLTDEHGELPETRTVKTGSGGMHYYWDASNNAIHSGVLTENIHIKGNAGNAFVCAPPTMHKSGNIYEYINRCKPVVAPDWLVSLVQSKQKKNITSRGDYTQSPYNTGSIAEDYGLNCMEIGAPIDAHQTDEGFQGSHPFHGSTTGVNFAINTRENVWRCFRCQSGGGALELFAIKKGIIACENAKPGWLKKHHKEVIAALEADGYVSKEGTWKQQMTRQGKEIIKQVWGI